MSAHSSSRRKSPGCTWSMTSLCFSVYWPVGVYAGGQVGNTDISSRGLPLTLQVMRNLLGSSILTDRILSVTGLYFLPTKIASGVLALSMVYSCTFTWDSNLMRFRLEVSERKKLLNNEASESQRDRYAAATLA